MELHYLNSKANPVHSNSWARADVLDPALIYAFTSNLLAKDKVGYPVMLTRLSPQKVFQCSKRLFGSVKGEGMVKVP